MELIQRFGCQFNDEYVDAYIAQMRKHPGSCDRVWLPTSYNYPTLKEHRAFALFPRLCALPASLCGRACECGFDAELYGG